MFVQADLPTLQCSRSTASPILSAIDCAAQSFLYIFSPLNWAAHPDSLWRYFQLFCEWILNTCPDIHIVLLLNEWSGKRTGTVPDPEREMANVFKCMRVVRMCESRWQIAILAELASIGQLPLPTNGTPDASHMFPGVYQPDDRHPSADISGAGNNSGTLPMDPSPFAPTPASETWFPPDDPYADISTDPAQASRELEEMMSLIDSDTISMWTNTPVGVEVDDLGTYFTKFSETTM
ncbi:hypothetical protein B0H14DRAFT_3696877 [Mycena olivaceomarginata]|nr:hypothetical protein B0H14DRAFT_3696877 [Mycena olivaceomarginata]